MTAFRTALLLTICWLAIAGPMGPPAMAQTASSDIPEATARTEAMDPNGSPAQAPMTDIHDIKPPERPVPRPVWLFYLLAVALTLALLALILLAFRRRRRDRSTPAFPPLSPSQQALKALEEIRDVERVEGRVFYFRLSAILREYLKGRFGINAPEMTVEELLPRIRELNLPTDLQGNLSAFFRNAEPVKFAGRAAVQRQMEADLAFSVAFVRETDPGKDDLSENETARKGAAA